MPQKLMSSRIALLTSVAALALGAAMQAHAADDLLVDAPAPRAVTAGSNPAPVAPAVKAAPQKAPQTAPEANDDVAGKAPPAAAKNDAPVIAPLPDSLGGPDESALRYYASLQQTQRVDTEIKRLKRLYPNWTPPDRLYDTPAPGGVDEQPFWDLFSADRMDELRAEIAKRKREEPGWNPSPELIDKMKRKETRLTIMGMFKAGRWKDLVGFVKDNGYGGADADVDVAWTVAEAFAKTKQTADALNVYKTILKDNREPTQRLATVQKAMATLRMRDVEELVVMGKANEFVAIAIDLTRGRISAFLHDERAELIPADELKAFEDYARAAKDPNQPGLVAWYYYKTKAFQQALDWFKHALSRGGDAMIAHGLAHSLRELGLYRDTEEVAYAWREPLVNNAILFIDILERDLTKEIPPYIEPHRLMRYAQVTMDVASGEGAQALAWYAYNTCQFDVAHEWFLRANAWLPKEATAYGLALTLRRLNKTKEFWDLVNRYDGLFPKVVEIVYPDGYYHPPTPCDLLKRGALAYLNNPRAPQGQPVMAPQPAMAPQPVWSNAPVAGYAGMHRGLNPAGAAPTTAPQPGAPAQSYPMQPAPMQPMAPVTGAQPYCAALPQAWFNYQAPNTEPKLTGFPASVDVENPLRQAGVLRLTGPLSPQAMQSAAAGGPMQREAFTGMAQLVARRVPGVGAMPYERWGYTLLAGYNGAAAPSPPHSAEKAPEGTLWMTLQAGDARSTRNGGADANRQDIDPCMALRRLAEAPRVPPPQAAANGPWTAPRPYMSDELRREMADTGMQGAAAAPASAGAPASLLRDAPSQQTQPPAAHGASLLSPATQTTQVAKTLVKTPVTSPVAPAPILASLAAPTPLAGAAPNDAQPGRLSTSATDALAREATDLYNQRQYAAALLLLDRRAQTMKEPEDLRLMRAWSLLNLGRVDEARAVFNAMGPSARKTASGAPRSSGKN